MQVDECDIREQENVLDRVIAEQAVAVHENYTVGRLSFLLLDDHFEYIVVAFRLLREERVDLARREGRIVIRLKGFDTLIILAVQYTHQMVHDG